MANKRTGRDYTRDIQYESSPRQKKRRAARNKARRAAIRKGLVTKGSKMDIHHTDSEHMKGLKVVPRSKNRGFKRSKTGKNKGLRKK